VGPIAIIAVVSLLGFDGYYPVMLIGILASVVMFIKFNDIPPAVKQRETSSAGKTCREMKGVLAPLSTIVLFRTAGWLQFPFLILTGFSLLSTTPVMLAMI
jgi:MFS transporter, FSR family, fosmidomycin resistance protein